LGRKGKFREAQEMDFKEAQEKFPGKYDQAIQRAKDYTNLLDTFMKLLTGNGL